MHLSSRGATITHLHYAGSAITFVFAAQWIAFPVHRRLRPRGRNARQHPLSHRIPWFASSCSLARSALTLSNCWWQVSELGLSAHCRSTGSEPTHRCNQNDVVVSLRRHKLLLAAGALDSYISVFAGAFLILALKSTNFQAIGTTERVISARRPL